MKWYHKAHYSFAREQILDRIKLLDEEENHVLKFYKLAYKFARNVNCDEQRIGILNLQDIMQICLEGLVAAWNRVDWSKLEDKPNWQKSLVNYLSSNIQGNIKRRVYQEATGVRVPESQIRKTKAELIADRLFGNWMYQFKLDDILAESEKIIRYIDIIDYDPIRSSGHENDMLNDKLSTIMFKYLSDKERQILRWNFGIDDDKLTISEIADKLRMSVRGVEDAKRRALSKLHNHESEFILKDFL